MKKPPGSTVKIPTYARNFAHLFAIGLAAIGLTLFTRATLAQSVDPVSEKALREVDVIRLAQSRSPGAAVANATDAFAKAEEENAGLFANPTLSWDRETVQTGPQAGQGSQDILGATFPIDIARPLATRSLAASESAWMRAEASLSRNDATLSALFAYYAVALAERRVEVLSRSVADLEEAARVLTRREAAGEASGYESARLVIASQLMQSELTEARGHLQSEMARLAPLIGVSAESLRVRTDLRLMSAAEASALASSTGGERQAVRLARESQRLADQAQDRASWAWLPTLELGAGVKRANNLNSSSGYGYALGVSVSVPLFDHGQAERGQAEAQKALASARADALTTTIGAEVKSAMATFLATREELERFEIHTQGQVEALLTAAKSGYLEGERTIVELLDAQRAQTEVAERCLELLGRAKRAEAQLRAAAGDMK